MTHVLKLCRRLDVATTSCDRLNSVRKLCLSRASTHGLLLPHTKRVDGHGQSSICTSSGHLAFLPQNSDGFKKNRGLGVSNESSNGGSRDEAHFKFAGSRFRQTLLAVGGIVIGGVVLMSPTLLAEEKSEDTCEPEFGGGKLSSKEATEISQDLIQRIKDESGSPGLVISVTVDGQEVFTQGVGYADVENRVKCSRETVFRIASISKPITMAAVARLWEEGKLDLDKPVQHYVPEFPEKTWKGEKVTITTRQLLSHLAGIRHYDKDYMKGVESKAEKKYQIEKESYIKKHFQSVSESLKLFKDDPLIKKPGSEFYYTSHGWTLISAVVASAANVKFETYLQRVLDELGLKHTYMEEQDKLIYHRGRHYVRNAKGKLENAPYTDLSYKWAGGGLVSTVVDLVRFGASMLYSYQATGKGAQLMGYLKPETIKEMWTKVDKTSVNWGMGEGGGYGLGWAVWDTEQKYGWCKDRQFFVSHTGGAVGASSVLLIVPAEKVDPSKRIPQGVVVSIVVNMTGVSLLKTAHEIAEVWEKVDLKTLDISHSQGNPTVKLRQAM